jgi:peptide deformylase
MNPLEPGQSEALPGAELSGPVTREELAQLGEELELVSLTHPVLRRRARPFAAEALGSPELARLVEAMWRVLDPLGYGVGLAAPQVGLPYALFCLDDHDGLRFALANPQPVGLPAAELLEDTEGCLSIPGFWGRVRRSATRSVRGYLPDGREIQIDGQGFSARILAHETDHLVGRLYVDRLEAGSFAPDNPFLLPGGAVFDRRQTSSRLRRSGAR